MRTIVQSGKSSRGIRQNILTTMIQIPSKVEERTCGGQPERIPRRD